MNIQDTLKERGATHGNFIDNARLSQELKGVMVNSPNWEKLSPSQKESLHMIAHKVSRVLAGNPDEVDHWKDLSGYATLIVNELERAQNPLTEHIDYTKEEPIQLSTPEEELLNV